MPRTERTVDAVVIGGGASGENAAARAAAAGLDVVLVEAELVGGECSYWACMPSKALLRPGEALDAARRVPGAAAAVTGGLDVGAVLERRDKFISHLDDAGQVSWLDDAGVGLVRGHARLDGERTVVVTHDDSDHDDRDQTVLSARRAVVLAVGSAPSLPPIDGFADTRIWTSRDATTAEHVPDRLLLLGGGVAGVELAQAWQSLGAQVTIVEHGKRLIDDEEPFAGEEVGDALRERGVVVELEAQAVSVTRGPDDRGPVSMALADGRELVGDELLVATGRRPRTVDVGLDTVGLQPGEIVEVDDRLRAAGVEGGWLYAVGDVNGRALLTHQGKYQARIVGDLVAGGSDGGRAGELRAWADHRALPRVVFTDPQVAAVGRTEAAARDEGLAVRAVTYDVGATAGGSLAGRGVHGTSKLVIDDDRDVVVGATFVGPQAAEMLHAATIAVAAEVPISMLWHAVPPFPTMSEVWLRLLEADGRSAHR